jgi:hypothetical protein
LFDLNKDGFLDQEEWQMQRDRNAARKRIVPSPLFYQNVLYVLKEGGILTALNPEDGRVLKAGSY